MSEGKNRAGQFEQDDQMTLIFLSGTTENKFMQHTPTDLNNHLWSCKNRTQKEAHTPIGFYQTFTTGLFIKG